MAVLPHEHRSAGSTSGPSPPVPEENLWRLVDQGFFAGQITFLSPNRPYQSTEGNRKCRSLFIYNWTPGGRGIAFLMPAF